MTDIPACPTCTTNTRMERHCRNRPTCRWWRCLACKRYGDPASAWRSPSDERPTDADIIPEQKENP